MNEETVYNLAKVERKITTPVGRLTIEDLEDIVEDPPVVDFKTYIRLKSMSQEQLLEMEPALEVLAPDEDLFFYFTRGYLRNNPYLRSKINDFYNFDKLDEINQDLLLKIYKTKTNYLNRTSSHPLEYLIFAYDKVMGTESRVRELAEANGLNISGYEDADEGFVNELSYLL